jgi:hypothetical protein
LLDQDALSKVYLLRKYLTDMSEVNALVFLLERLQPEQRRGWS